MGTFRRHILAPAFYLNAGDGVLISSCAWCLHPHTIERSALIDHPDSDQNTCCIHHPVDRKPSGEGRGEKKRHINLWCRETIRACEGRGNVKARTLGKPKGRAICPTLPKRHPHLSLSRKHRCLLWARPRAVSIYTTEIALLDKVMWTHNNREKKVDEILVPFQFQLRQFTSSIMA
ncbi:hypothetical protein BC826DRAFT_968679 [Russula brevipes]|nr:hypothetical protein BC826DRAFT_968679 [Russula brevipes]